MVIAFSVSFLIGKSGNAASSPCDQQRARAALERVDAEQHGRGAGAGGAVENDVDALAAGELEHPLPARPPAARR